MEKQSSQKITVGNILWSLPPLALVLEGNSCTVEAMNPIAQTLTDLCT